MCELSISMLKQDLSNPYNNRLANESLLAGWKSARRFLDLFPKRGAIDEKPVGKAPSSSPITIESAMPVSADKTTSALDRPFTTLLLAYTVPELKSLLTELGLLHAATSKVTESATAGALVGVIYGLLEANPPRLRDNKAAIQRAFCKVFGAKVSERAVQAGLGKRNSEAEKFRDRTLLILGRASS
jgi:hypothetical protein